jgi:hypothetical protein
MFADQLIEVCRAGHGHPHSARRGVHQRKHVLDIKDAIDELFVASDPSYFWDICRLGRLVSRATEICPPAAGRPAHWWPRVLPGGGQETAQRCPPELEVVDHVSGVTP